MSYLIDHVGAAQGTRYHRGSYLVTSVVDGAITSLRWVPQSGRRPRWRLLTRMNTLAAGAACVRRADGSSLSWWRLMELARRPPLLKCCRLPIWRPRAGNGRHVVGAWSALPAMTAARYGGTLVAV